GPKGRRPLAGGFSPRWADDERSRPEGGAGDALRFPSVKFALFCPYLSAILPLAPLAPCLARSGSAGSNKGATHRTLNTPPSPLPPKKSAAPRRRKATGEPLFPPERGHYDTYAYFLQGKNAIFFVFLNRSFLSLSSRTNCR